MVPYHITEGHSTFDLHIFFIISYFIFPCQDRRGLRPPSAPHKYNNIKIMRVLVLHPKASSSSTLSVALSSLKHRLLQKHEIELVFVDAPLLDLDTDEEEESGGGEGVSMRRQQRRRWYVEEAQRGAAVVAAASNANTAADGGGDDSALEGNVGNQVRYSGLDASLLHLSQVWSSRGVHCCTTINCHKDNNGLHNYLPFRGVVGIQQGADVAAMLPLLNDASSAYYNDDDDEEETAMMMAAASNRKRIFDGLQFVILVDGNDIIKNPLHQQDYGEETYDDEGYVGPNGIASLHIISEGGDNNSERNSELLAKRYGPNATIQYYKPNSTKNNNHLKSPTFQNILGRYLVQQKNLLHSNHTQRKLLHLHSQLSSVEQLASLAISDEVQRNPPKCLLAMIGIATNSSAADVATAAAATNYVETNVVDIDESLTDEKNRQGGEEDTNCSSNKYYEKRRNEEEDNQKEVQKKVVGKTVGAWRGQGRIPGEQGGGAPCPESFLLRQEERRRRLLGTM